jgi:transmembrane sensor
MTNERSLREIRAEAASWLARLHADDRNRSDEEAFRAWMAADPAHAQAFEAIDHAWSLAGGLARKPLAARKGLSRRTVMAGAAGLTAIAVGTFSFMQSGSARTYRTDVGEQKHVSLSDGTQLFMNAQTQLKVRLTDTQRTVELDYGRANFRVTPDSHRPFIVQAAGRRIVANQCTFDVRCEDGDVQVVLIRGRASIQGADGQALAAARPSETMQAGDRVVARGDRIRRDRPNLTPLLAWQTGSAVFENETLAGAIQEMNRYSSEKLEAADARVSDMRVSGVYRVGDNVSFARSISRLLPVTVDRQGDRLLLTAADSEK